MEEKGDCEVNWRWLAGVFDAKGDIRIAQKKFLNSRGKVRSITYQLTITLFLNFKTFNLVKSFYDFQVIEYFAECCRVGIQNKKKVFEFLKLIYPYLIIKKPWVDYILDNYNFRLSTNEDFDYVKWLKFKKTAFDM